MNKEKLISVIKDIVQEELRIPLYENMLEDDSLLSAGIDSISFMTLIICLEENFSIEFEFDGIFLSDYSEITFNNLIDEVLKLTE